MSAVPEPKLQPELLGDKPVFNVMGVLLQFLATPEEVGDATCLMRGTLPPGTVVPLHKHADPEIFYILEGSLEVFQSKDGSNGWRRAGEGCVVTIQGNVKHALRNSSSLPVTSVTVTKSELYVFFRTLAKPLDPNQPPAPPTPEALQEFFEVAAKYSYWLASPEENAAIGLPTFTL